MNLINNLLEKQHNYIDDVTDDLLDNEFYVSYENDILTIESINGYVDQYNMTQISEMQRAYRNYAGKQIKAVILNVWHVLEISE